MDPVDTREAFEADPNLELTELPDGSAVFDLPVAATAETGFYDNLADSLDDFTLNSTASELLELIEKDQEARKKRDEQQAEGIRRTGLGDDAPGGATFDGASKVVHPVLAEGCVDFSARAMKEIFPASGPVKTKIQGQATDEKLKKAKAKRDYLNWLLTDKIQEYRAEKEILLTQLPLGGSQYEKYWYDPVEKRIRMEFVPVDEVFLPYAATSFYTSPRVTHEQKLTRHTFEQRVRSGFYRDIDNLITEGTPEESDSEKATDKIEGKTESGYNEDGVRVVYEVQCWREFEDDTPKPYIIHIDEATSKVLAIYRNWEETDEEAHKLDWWVEDKFIPWRGAYGIGLHHLIGSLAGSATGALRALLDAAHINNSPGAVKLKGGRTSGQNIQIDQTGVAEIEAPAGTDDVRKVIMPLPFNPPSPVLYQLLEWITAQAKGVVATAEERIADASNQMPVGTALALIEQGSQVFSSIHARLHDSQRRALKIICRLSAQYPDVESMQRFGVMPEDFTDDSDIEPVSDPHIFSEAQRYAQYQAVMQMSQDPRVQYNAIELHRWGLELLKVDRIDSLLPKPPTPVTADPVTENVAAVSTGAPLKAVPQQDHLAHIMTHVGFIVNPVNQLIPSPMPALAGIMKHVEEHLLMFYQVTVQAALVNVAQQAMASGEQASQDQLMMRAAQQAQQLVANLLQDAAPMMQQAAQVIQAKMPQPPIDPAIQKTFEAAMAEVKRKAEADAARLQFDKEKLATEKQFDAMQAQIANAMEERKQAEDIRIAELTNVMKFQLAKMQEEGQTLIEEMRQRVELMKNEKDNEQKQMTELIKNYQDNLTQMQLSMQKVSQDVQRVSESGFDFSQPMEQLNRMLSTVESARTQDALGAVVEGLRAAIEQMNAPKMIIERDGKPVGIAPAK